jgi:DNA-binding response OmpR family regulator
VVLDVMLPDGSGLELLKQLRSEHAELPVLMLGPWRTAGPHPRPGAGCRRLPGQTLRPRELTARLRAVLRRSHPAAVSTQLELGDLSFSPVRGVVSIDERELTLTVSESRCSKPCCASSPANRWTNRNWRRSASAAS